MENEIKPQEPVSVPAKTKSLAIQYILIVIIVALVGTIGYLLYRQSKDSGVLDVVKNNNGPEVVVTDNPNSQTPYATPEQVPPPTNPDTEPKTWVDASFLPAWVKVAAECPDKNNCYVTNYQIGSVTSGQYTGQKLYLQVEQSLGNIFQHYVKVNGQPVYFETERIGIRGINDVPQTITWPDTGYQLRKNYTNFAFKDIKQAKKMFTDPILGAVYLSDDGCFYVELPDHTALGYDLQTPFIDREQGIAKITFNGNAENKEAYDYIRPGCLELCIHFSTIEESTLKPVQRLVQVGKTSNGEAIFGLKDPNDQVLKDMYADQNTMAYYTEEGQQQPKSKYTYAQFTSYRPLLYWKDPLGRWVELKNRRFAPAAEMCKPVMYLYPTKQTTLDVTVSPNGGFTKTDPAYGTGWHVIARPNGTLTDLKTNKEYSYLFWEGIGLQYPRHTDGFVVAKKDVNAFLTDKLTLLGLRGQELADFKEYWVVRLAKLDQPYVKINFLTRAEFDGIAPLTIGPTNPNTVIRIMMTAQPLAQFVSVPEQKLTPAPERKGFTVVEWGGAVLQ